MTGPWQDAATGFGIGFAAFAATNLDNLLLVGGLIAGGARRASVATGFAIAVSLTLLVASAFSFLSCLLSPSVLGFLGIVPIALGLRILLSGSAVNEGTTQVGKAAASIAAFLLANSLDTVATFAPIFAESEAGVRLALLGGFLVSAAVLFSLVVRPAQRLSSMRHKGTVAQRIAGVVMILVGIYVLLDTGTDLE